MSKIDQKIEHKIIEGDSWYESFDPVVIFGIALEHFKNEDYNKGCEPMEYAAKHGHADAQYELGLMHYEIYTQVGNPDDVAAAFPEALKWLREAADQGHAEAQFFYGLIHYDMAQGVDAYPTIELEIALTWFHKAADQGLAKGQYFLGYMYQNGEGVGIDSAESLKWYGKAAHQEHAEAQFRLGYIYQMGDGVTIDLDKAMELYCKAADQGHEDATEILKKMFITNIHSIRRNLI